jgi:hypothetical protein
VGQVAASCPTAPAWRWPRSTSIACGECGPRSRWRGIGGCDGDPVPARRSLAGRFDGGRAIAEGAAPTPPRQQRTAAAAAAAPADPQALLAAARTARAAGDLTTYLAQVEAAAAAVPDRRQVAYRLAGALALNGRLDAALAELRTVARLGVDRDVEHEPDLAALHGLAAWPEIVAAFAENRRPLARGVEAFRLAERDLLTEGIAYDPASRSFFVSSVHRGKIVRRACDGRVDDFRAARRAMASERLGRPSIPHGSACGRSRKRSRSSPTAAPTRPAGPRCWRSIRDRSAAGARRTAPPASTSSTTWRRPDAASSSAIRRRASSTCSPRTATARTAHRGRCARLPNGLTSTRGAPSLRRRLRAWPRRARSRRPPSRRLTTPTISAARHRRPRLTARAGGDPERLRATSRPALLLSADGRAVTRVEILDRAHLLFAERRSASCCRRAVLRACSQWGIGRTARRRARVAEEQLVLRVPLDD